MELPRLPTARRSDDRRTVREFTFALLSALLLTLLALGCVQFFFATRAAQEEQLGQQAATVASWATSVEVAYESAPRGQGPYGLAENVLQIARRSPGVVDLFLVDADALVTADQYRSGTPAPHQLGPVVAQALATGRPAMGPLADGTPAYWFAQPIDLVGERHVLVAVDDGAALGRTRAGIRQGAMFTVLNGMLLGGPMFYAFGGRRLLRTHRRVNDLAVRDGLTMLGNHRAFQEDLRREVAVARREGHDLTLLLVDLDDFKLVNDQHGHRRGDMVLAAIARLLHTDRAGDRAYRIGGDEFTLLLPRTTAAAGRLVGERVRAAVQEAALGVTISVGVAHLHADTDGPDTLWGLADVALYEVKRRGRNGVATFSEVADTAAVVTPAKTAALRRLIDERRVDAVFQPIWDLELDRLLGFEALARPELDPSAPTLVSPLEAFAVASATGRTGDLDAVCRQAILARAALLPAGAKLFMNLSPRSLGHASLEGDRLAREVVAAGLLPEQVVLEITEREIAQPGMAAKETARLRALGFQIALDDVGAGNAGLELLRRVPVEYVKVDREIVASAPVDAQARAVLLAVVAFARETGAFVIAEGVESAEELTFLLGIDALPAAQRNSVHGAQGYLLGRPHAQPQGSSPFPVRAAAAAPVMQ